MVFLVKSRGVDNNNAFASEYGFCIGEFNIRSNDEHIGSEVACGAQAHISRPSDGGQLYNFSAVMVCECSHAAGIEPLHQLSLVGIYAIVTCVRDIYTMVIL